MMSTAFSSFGYRLKEQLQKPLPGIDAQIKMAPKPVNPRRFKEDFEDPARPSAVMILLYPHQSEIHLPLMKRPQYPGVHSGQISFPGGKPESTDRDLIHTALRETEEEIGVGANRIEVIGELTDLFVIASNFRIKPIVGLANEKPEFIPDPHEVDGVLNVSLSHLYNIENQGVETMKFKNNITIESPYFNVQGNVVWGATAMILSELLEVIKPILK